MAGPACPTRSSDAASEHGGAARGGWRAEVNVGSIGHLRQPGAAIGIRSGLSGLARSWRAALGERFNDARFRPLPEDECLRGRRAGAVPQLLPCRPLTA